MNKVYERMTLSLIEAAKKKGKILPGPGSQKRSSSRSEYKSDVVKKDPHLSDDDMKSKKRHPILGDIFKDMGSTFDMKKELDKLNISKLPKDKK